MEKEVKRVGAGGIRIKFLKTGLSHCSHWTTMGALMRQNKPISISD